MSRNRRYNQVMVDVEINRYGRGIESTIGNENLYKPVSVLMG